MRFNAFLEDFVNEKLCVAVSPCIKFSLFSLVSMQSRRLLVGCRWTWHWSDLGPSWQNALAGGHCWGHLPLHHHVRSFCIPFLARSEFPIYILINCSKLARRTGVNVDWYHVIPDFGLNRSPLWSRFNYISNNICEIFVLLRAGDATSMWCSPPTPALVSRSWTIRWDINLPQAWIDFTTNTTGHITYFVGSVGARENS